MSHYISYLEVPGTRLLNHYYTRCTKMETKNSKALEMIEKRDKFQGSSKKQSVLELR